MIGGMICEVDFPDAVANQGRRRRYSPKVRRPLPFSDQRQHSMMQVAN